jgi:ABC-2 type transport system permease protein
MLNNRSKIMTIISHEYLTKIKSKGFIWSTLLAPLGLLVFIGIIGGMAFLSETSNTRKIAIVDESGLIGEKVVENDTSSYFMSQKSTDELEKEVLAEKLDGYLYIPKNFLDSGRANVYSLGGGGLNFIDKLERRIWKVTRKERLLKANLTDSVIKKIEQRIDISTNKITETGTEEDYAQVFAGLGYALGFIIYMMMMIYGGLVSSSVIEEKSNRIVEVIASSVRPIDIMMGKVVGIGMVGLTQILFWMIIFVGLLLVSGPIISSFAVDPAQMQDTVAQMQQQMGPMQAGNTNEVAEGFQEAISVIMSFVTPGVIAAFIYFFLIGYLIFSTIFAGLGAAVDQQTDANQLQMPITLFAIMPMLLIQFVMSDPDSTLSVVVSLFPLFSPTLMIVRIAATDVPLWQIVSSVLLTLGTFYGILYISAKIYKVGILMYGAKPSFKDLFKWIRA